MGVACSSATRAVVVSLVTGGGDAATNTGSAKGTVGRGSVAQRWNHSRVGCKGVDCCCRAGYAGCECGRARERGLCCSVDDAKKVELRVEGDVGVVGQRAYGGGWRTAVGLVQEMQAVHHWGSNAGDSTRGRKHGLAVSAACDARRVRR